MLEVVVEFYLIEKKSPKYFNVMAKNGLDKWFAQKWVDIGSKKKDGSFSKCGRSKQKKDAKRKYPKCVPLAKARRMTEGQRRSAVKRKRSVAQGAGMTKKGVNAYKRRNPGSKLKTAATTAPSKLKPGSKPAKRRKAFCSRSRSWTSDRGKAARRRWNC